MLNAKGLAIEDEKTSVQIDFVFIKIYFYSDLFPDPCTGGIGVVADRSSNISDRYE